MSSAETPIQTVNSRQGGNGERIKAQAVERTVTNLTIRGELEGMG